MRSVNEAGETMTQAKRKFSLRLILLAMSFAALGLASGYLFTHFGQTEYADVAGQGDASSGIVIHDRPQMLPDVSFEDSAGRTKHLSDLHGRTLLVNLWATWCAPCKREMPALNRLQQKLGGDAFKVLAIATDRTGFKEPRAFLDNAGLKALDLYKDDTAEIVRTLKAEGLPLSVFVNPEGKEIARLLGTADWDSADVQATVAQLITKPR